MSEASSVAKGSGSRKSQPSPLQPSFSQPATTQRKCSHSAASASRSVWGPPAPGPCTNSDFPLFPVILASSLQMASIWDLQGATVLGPSPRPKSRLRFSKSYRYWLFTFHSWGGYFSSPSVAVGSLKN